MTDQELLEWVRTTCLLFGARPSTALRVAAEFATALERGEISTAALTERDLAAVGAADEEIAA